MMEALRGTQRQSAMYKHACEIQAEWYLMMEALRGTQRQSAMYKHACEIHAEWYLMMEALSHVPKRLEQPG